MKNPLSRWLAAAIVLLVLAAAGMLLYYAATGGVQGDGKAGEVKPLDHDLPGLPAPRR